MDYFQQCTARQQESKKRQRDDDEPTCPHDIPWTSSEYELPHGIFDDDEPGEVWRAVPWRWPAKDFLVSSHGYYRVRDLRRHGEYNKKTRGCLANGRYVYKNVQASILVCEAFRGRKPTPQHTCDHFYHERKDDNHIDNLWWRTKSQQAKNRRVLASKCTGQPVDARKKGTNDDWIPYPSRGAAAKATDVGEFTIHRILRKDPGAGRTLAYEFRKGAPFESQEEILSPNDKDPEEERWSFARRGDGTLSDRHLVSTRGRARTKTPTGDAWSLIYTPKPSQGHEYAKFAFGSVQSTFHIVVWCTFCPDTPIDYANGASIDHKDRDPTNNALYNLRSSDPSQQALNQVRKDRTKIMDTRKRDVWGLPADAPADTPREWLGPSVIEAAEALSVKLGMRVDHGSVSNGILIGRLTRGWRCFATPDAATDAKVAAEHRRVLAALNALPAWQE